MWSKLKRRQAYRKLFCQPGGGLKAEGRQVLDDLYEFSLYFKNSPLEPQRLAAVEGSRAVVRRIVAWLNISDGEIRRQLEKSSYDTQQSQRSEK